MPSLEKTDGIISIYYNNKIMEKFFIWKTIDGYYVKVNSLRLSKVKKASNASYHKSIEIANTWKNAMEKKYPGVKLIEAELVEKQK